MHGKIASQLTLFTAQNSSMASSNSPSFSGDPSKDTPIVFIRSFVIFIALWDDVGGSLDSGSESASESMLAKDAFELDVGSTIVPAFVHMKLSNGI